MNYFEMLGVTEQATDEEVRNKYKQKLRQFHPDSNIQADEGDKAFYEMMTRNLTEAYEALKTAERRKVYAKGLITSAYGQNANNSYTQSNTSNMQTSALFTNLYQYIEGRATSNSLIQGISGIAGFPWNLVADAGTVFTHYVPMVNRIRDYFGYKPFEADVIESLLKSIAQELMIDVIGDKILGSIPILGGYFNYKCAKIMTWRIGILFAIVNCQGETYNDWILKEAARLVRKVFPSDMLSSDSSDKAKKFMEVTTAIYEAENGYEKIKALNKRY